MQFDSSRNNSCLLQLFQIPGCSLEMLGPQSMGCKRAYEFHPLIESRALFGVHDTIIG